MYHAISLLPDAHDTARAYMCADIPVIEFSGEGRTAVHVPHETPEQALGWLRSLAASVEDLAEQIEGTIPAADPVSTVELYECEHCDAKFGIAGTSTGSGDDIAAGEYFHDQVRFHDSGECKRTAVTA